MKIEVVFLEVTAHAPLCFSKDGFVRKWVFSYSNSGFRSFPSGMLDFPCLHGFSMFMLKRNHLEQYRRQTIIMTSHMVAWLLWLLVR